MFDGLTSPIPIISDCRFVNEAKWFKDKEITSPDRGKVIIVEIDRFDSGLTPPDEELKNQPLLKPYIDHVVRWPTSKIKTERALEKDLMIYVTDFLTKYNL